MDIENNLTSTKPMRAKIAACRVVPVTLMAGKGTVVCGVVERQKRQLGSWEMCADDVQGGFIDVALAVLQSRNHAPAFF